MLTQHLRTLLLTEAKRHESFYFYDEQTLKESIHHLQQAFPHEQILYSIKCNPHRAMLKTIFASGIDADAASLGEVYAASDCGVPSDHIYYSAPGKSDYCLEKALSSRIA